MLEKLEIIDEPMINLSQALMLSTLKFSKVHKPHAQASATYCHVPVQIPLIQLDQLMCLASQTSSCGLSSQLEAQPS